MNSKTKSILFVALALTAGMVGAGIVNHFDDDSRNGHVGLMKSNNGFHQVNYSGLSAAPIDFVLPAEASVPTVVHVTTTYPRQSGMGNHMVDPFSFFWGNPNPREMPPQQSTGSGVIISEDGYIVTNNHVVENGDEVNVTLDNKESYKAKVIGLDPSTDLALLKVDANNLPFAAWGNSDQVKVGEWVLAVGNPFDLTSTVTAGIISAKARDIDIIKGGRAIESFIQTDAAVNPGNSGGALVDVEGRLIGINSAIATPTGVFAGYSFAIPVNLVKRIADDLIKYGTFKRAYLGVNIATMDSNVARELNIEYAKGVAVVEVADLQGSAALSGILQKDIITQVNGKNVTTTSELMEYIGRSKVGETVDVSVIRDGKARVIPVRLKTKSDG